MSNSWRKPLAIFVLVATAVLTVFYLHRNPDVITAIGHIPPALFIVLLLLYGVMMAVLALVFLSTTMLAGYRMPTRESLLVTAYSAIVNFFGPLQSGPAFRAVYLRDRHHVKLKNYTAATLLYYLFFAIFSGIALLYGVLHWWLIPAVLAGCLLLYLVWRSDIAPVRPIKRLHFGGLGLLLLASLLQVVVGTFIYYAELRHVDPGVHFSQAVIYTGAANFSLFVSITPGAIGFREAFLLFSRNLHHISAQSIVAASLIDRAMYLVVLGILAVFIFGSHAERRLRGGSATKNDATPPTLS